MEVKFTSTESVRINNKIVYLREPYRAGMGKLVGRDDVVRSVLGAWMHRTSRENLHPLLVGDPGVGKNHIAYECARICRKDLYIFQGTNDPKADELLCVPRSNDDHIHKMDYVLSYLTTAMVKGGVVFLDEIGKIPAEALTSILSLLDDRRHVDCTLLAERIHAAKGFRFIAGANWSDLKGNDSYESIRSRLLPPIPVNYLSQEEIERIIRSRFAAIHENGNHLLRRFWDLWHELDPGLPPTPRQAIQIFGFAINLADLDEALESGTVDLDGEPSPSLTLRKEHLEEAFSLFADSRAEEASWNSSH